MIRLPLDVLLLPVLLGVQPLLLSAAPTSVRAQAATGARAQYPVGLTVAYGLGAYGVRDEAISKQRYEGTLPYLGVSWARGHQRYVYQLGMEIRRSDAIRNHSVGTTIIRFALGQAFLYPVASSTAWGRDLGLFLGPTTELALFLNEQHIAVDALGFAESVTGLVSLGVRADAVLSASRRITTLASLRTSVLSLGIHAVDDEVDDASPAKLLVPPAGINASLEMGAIYRATGRLSFRLAYLFQLGRVSAWDPLLDASDSVVGGLSWRF